MVHSACRPEKIEGVGVELLDSGLTQGRSLRVRPWSQKRRLVQSRAKRWQKWMLMRSTLFHQRPQLALLTGSGPMAMEGPSIPAHLPVDLSISIPT